jgi:hypothetical protein
MTRTASLSKYVSELQHVPIAHIQNGKWPMEQRFWWVIIGEDYPLPIVDLQESVVQFRDKVDIKASQKSSKKMQKRLVKDACEYCSFFPFTGTDLSTPKEWWTESSSS